MSDATIDRLLGHARFVRALAHELLGDTAAAEDVEQETWRAALESAPPREPRAWLARVMRNFARRSLRDVGRREVREQLVARSETVPGADALVAQRETLRIVVDAVLALPEPYRATVLMRFYEDLPPREIAMRCGVPVDTVQTRLRRAIERLRNSLEKRSSEWRSSLAVFVGTRATLSSSTSAISSSAIAKLASITALLALAAVFAAHKSASTPRALASAATPEAATETALEPSEDARIPAASDAVQGARVSGRVLDTEGRPLETASVFIGAASDPFGSEGATSAGLDDLKGQRFATDAEGRYSAVLPSPTRVAVRLWPTVHHESAARNEPVWVDAPVDGVDLIARTVPVARFRVRAKYANTRRPLADFLVALNMTGGRGRTHQVRAHGEVATIEASVFANESGAGRLDLLKPKTAEPVGMDVVLEAGTEREIVLVVPVEDRLGGYVVDRDGRAIEGAYVWFGDERGVYGDEPFDAFSPSRVAGAARSAADGWFELEGNGEFVSAWHAEHSPATVARADGARIVLLPRASIRGVLLDADGRPKPSTRIDLDDDAPDTWTDTDELGAFEFRSVESGAHLLSCARRALLAVRLKPGERADVELRELAGSLELEFTCDGAPLELSELDGVLVGLDARFSLCRVAHWRPKTADPSELETGFVSGGNALLRIPSPPLATINERVQLGRYALVTRQGVTAELEVHGPRALVDLSGATVEIRSASACAVQVVPSSADDFARQVAARCAIELAAGARHSFRASRGRHDVIDRSGRVLRTLEVQAEPIVIELP